MQCSLIQELLDAHKIIDQSKGLDDVIMLRGDHQFTIKDWFYQHPGVMHQLHLTPDNITYQLVNKRINQAMADLF